MRNCKTTYCRNQAATHRTICHKCRSQKYKQDNPFRYFYNLHKQKAKQRCIPWSLTFKEFKQIWLESGKWDEKRWKTEITTTTWSMDRKNVNEGYHKDNIRIIPMALNVEVWWEEDRWEVDFRWRKMWSERNGKPIEDCPF